MPFPFRSLEELCATWSFSRATGIPSIEKAFCYGSCGWCSDSGSLCFMADKKRNNSWKDEGSCEQSSWNTDRWVSLVTLGGTGATGCWGTWAAWSLGWEKEPESLLLCQQLTAEPGAFIAACSWLSPELLGMGTTNFVMLLVLRWVQCPLDTHKDGAVNPVYLTESLLPAALSLWPVPCFGGFFSSRTCLLPFWT